MTGPRGAGVQGCESGQIHETFRRHAGLALVLIGCGRGIEVSEKAEPG